MKLVVLLVLTSAAVTSAQGGFGVVGSKVGSTVGAGVGLLGGTMLDTVPSFMGAQPSAPPRRGLPRRKPPGGGGMASEYEKDSEIIRERTIHEIERVNDREAGRSFPGERPRRRRPISN